MAEFRFQEQKTATLRHNITDEIRRAIFEGKLRPGDRLRETEISKQMGVSRGPLREALRMLEQEGLIVSQPYKETMVADISEEEALAVLIPIRITIEQFALTKAWPELTEEHFDNLRIIVREMEDGARLNNLSKVVECDLAFHEYLVGLSQMPSVISIWKSIYNRIRLYFIVQGQYYRDLIELSNSHTQLMKQLESGDLKLMTAALIEHIEDRKQT